MAPSFSLRPLASPARAWAWWLGLGLAWMVLAVVTPPFQVPDEHRHYFRAHQLADGQLFPIAKPAGAEEGRTVQPIHAALGGFLPRSVDALLLAVEADRLRFKPAERIEVASLREALSIRAEPADRVFFRFSHTIVYPPSAYVPQVIGLSLVRAATDRALLHVYGARLANVLAAVAILALAAWAAPGLWPAILGFCALPLATFQAASLSPDALVNASALAFAALTFSAGPGRPGARYWAQVAMLAILLTKPAYGPLVLLLLADRRWTVPARLAGAALACAPLLGWLALVSDLTGPVRTDVALDAGRQLARLVATPTLYPAIALGDLWQNGWGYATSMIGVLGWLDRPLSGPHLMAAVACSILGVVAARPAPVRHGWPTSLALVTSLLGSVALIQLALFLTFTPVGADRVIGVQGRYFLPLLAVALVAAAGRLGPTRRQTWTTAAIAASAILTAWTAWAVATAYFR